MEGEGEVVLFFRGIPVFKVESGLSPKDFNSIKDLGRLIDAFTINGDLSSMPKRIDMTKEAWLKYESMFFKKEELNKVMEQ